ncbi:hypothetical protein KC946_01465 [Candidatus Saccharibacteria bacterium]|nr:hypothetical protein [Candidatus Saccharibacteria bacterium]
MPAKTKKKTRKQQNKIVKFISGLNRKMVFILAFALVGTLMFINTFASTSAAQPTRENTGPRYSLTNMTVDEFYSTRTCNRQRITGRVVINQNSMKKQTFNMTDCEISGLVIDFGNTSPLSLDEMPILNLDYVYSASPIYTNSAAKLTADHSYFDNGKTQINIKQTWGPFLEAPAPFEFKNSVFWGPYQTQPVHTEALQSASYGSGYKFTNVAFIQEGGPRENTGVTATINFSGINSVFDGCWFIFDGPRPAVYTVYIAGKNNTVKNSWFDGADGNYVYPDSNPGATYTNNRNFRTGEAILGNTSAPTTPPTSTPTPAPTTPTPSTPSPTTPPEPVPTSNGQLPKEYGFNNGIVGWEAQGNTLISHDRTVGNDSAGSLKITTDQQGPYQDSTKTARAGTNQYTTGITAKAGQKIKGTFTTKSSVNVNARCELRFYNNNSIISTSNGTLSKLTNDWTGRTCTATAPNGTTHVALRFYSENSNYGDVFYLDDVTVSLNTDSTPTPAPTPAPTPTTPSTPTTTNDISPPTQVSNIKAALKFNFWKSNYAINLSWDKSTDNSGVEEYVLSRNDVQIGTTKLTKFEDTAIQPNTTYTYNIQAKDKADNVSKSITKSSTTRCFLIWCWLE